MKKFLLITLSFSTSVLFAQDVLKVDFSQTGDDSIQNGFVGYFAEHEVSASFETVEFDFLGSTIEFTPSWPFATPTPAEAKQLIKRTEERHSGDMHHLLKDWIGTDHRELFGNLTFTLKNLPAGGYSWLSYHHDLESQTGLTYIQVNDANGISEIFEVNQTSGEDATLADSLGTFETVLVSNGTDSITIEFWLEPANPSPIWEKFLAVNGFELSDGPSALNSYGSCNDNVDIAVYPQPANDLLTITSRSLSGELSALFYNYNGKLVKSESCEINSTISISDLSKGIYVLKLQTADALKTKKLIVL